MKMALAALITLLLLPPPALSKSRSFYTSEYGDMVREVEGRANEVKSDVEELLLIADDYARPVVGIGAVFEGLEYILRVKRVYKNTPAERAGLQVNDLVVAIDDNSYYIKQTLAKIRRNGTISQQLLLSVYRGEQQYLKITVTTVLQRADNRIEKAALLRTEIEKEAPPLLAKVYQAVAVVLTAFQVEERRYKEVARDPHIYALIDALTEFDNWYEDKKAKIIELLEPDMVD